MRKLVAIVFLLVLAAGVWYGARRFASRDDVRVTVIFKDAGALSRGAHVTVEDVVIGRVTKVAELETQHAVSIVVEKEHRNELLRDSIFVIREEGDSARLQVVNNVAVGSPLADGAVVYAREDSVSRWLAKHGPEVGALLGKLEGKARELVDDYESGKLTRELDQYREKFPEWKRQGEDVARRNLESLERRVEQMEEALRKENRDEEAEELKRRFETWRDGLKTDTAEREK
jgi:hypothetical protein